MGVDIIHDLVRLHKSDLVPLPVVSRMCRNMEVQSSPDYASCPIQVMTRAGFLPCIGTIISRFDVAGR